MRNRLLNTLRKLHISIPLRSSRTDLQKIGDAGESEAAQFLKSEKGYTILARNWKQGHHELDIVAMDRDVLVFVEVRSRQSSAKVSGYHSITTKKKNSLRNACRVYLNGMRRRAPHFRFDIIEIAHASCGQKTVKHFESIPLFNRHFF